MMSDNQNKTFPSHDTPSDKLSQFIKVIQSFSQGDFACQIPSDEGGEYKQLSVRLQELRNTFQEKLVECKILRVIVDKINAGTTVEDIMDLIYDSFHPYIPYNRIGLALLDEDEGIVRANWARSDTAEIRLRVGYSAKLEGSSLQKIIDTGKPRILNDLVTYLKEHSDSDSTSKIVEEGVQSSLTCPLIALGKPIGFLFFSSNLPNTYKDVHIDIFLQIAGQVSIIVEKAKLYQKVSHLNQLKNKFIGIVAHDLRNPLSVLIGFLSLFLTNRLGEVSPEQIQIMKKMEKACQNMLNLINDLLDISTIESGQIDLKLKEIELSEYLYETYYYNKILAESKNIELKLELPASLPKVKMDPDRINQVLNNLLSNAVKFSYPDTTVTLTAKVNERDVEILVSDQGQGIPPEDITRIFKDYEKGSVRPTGGEKSTGLGLAISKQIVKAHGGRIKVDSVVGTGSTFSFSIPVNPS